MITHGHIDHINALLMRLRHIQEGDAPMNILAPASIFYRLRQFAQLSWAVKVDDGQDLRDVYLPRPESERFDENVVFETEHMRWHAVVANATIELSVDKKCKTSLSVRTLKLFHNQCTSVGYLLSTPPAEHKSCVLTSWDPTRRRRQQIFNLRSPEARNSMKL